MIKTKQKFFQKKYWGTTCFYALLLIVSSVLISKCVSDKIKTVFLNQFHLKQPNFLLFAAVHFIPPMYSFANEFWYSHQLIDFDLMEKNKKTSQSVLYLWINHYPLRIVTFNLLRPVFFNQEGPQYVYLRSRFMNKTIRSIYQLQNHDSSLQIIPIQSVIERTPDYENFRKN